MTDRKGATAPGFRTKQVQQLFCTECDGKRCEFCGWLGTAAPPFFKKRGDEYREFRKKLGVSKIDAANRLGISLTDLEKVENGLAQLELRESGDG